MEFYTDTSGFKHVIAKARLVSPRGSQRSMGIVVDQCPYCLHTHRHTYSEETRTGFYGVREADCMKGQYMLIDETVMEFADHVPTEAQPAAPATAQVAGGADNVLGDGRSLRQIHRDLSEAAKARGEKMKSYAEWIEGQLLLREEHVKALQQQLADAQARAAAAESDYLELVALITYWSTTTDGWTHVIDSRGEVAKAAANALSKARQQAGG